jgi:hypothetical protein
VTTTNKPKLPSLRTENLIVKDLSSGELLIYDLETDKAFCLNEPARLIMDECNGSNSVDQALDSLNQKLKSKLNEEIVWLVIAEFKKSNFLPNDYEVPVQTAKISRRQVLQSAAALGIVLPLITSLVVPVAAQTASCIQPGQPCSQGGMPCCTGNCVNTESGPTGFQCVGT